MRAVKIAAVVMGVLIVVGTITLAVLIVRRIAPAAPAPIPPLSEPAGTRIAEASSNGDRLTLLLQGGGPDRVVVIDLRSGQIIARTGLAP